MPRTRGPCTRDFAHPNATPLVTGQDADHSLCDLLSLSLELVLRKTNDIQKCRIDRVMGGVHASAVFVGTFYARSRQLKRPLDCSRDASIVQFVCERLHVNIRASLDCIRCRQQVNTSGFRQSIHAAIIITPEVSQSVSCIPPAPR